MLRWTKRISDLESERFSERSVNRGVDEVKVDYGAFLGDKAVDGAAPQYQDESARPSLARSLRGIGTKGDIFSACGEDFDAFEGTQRTTNVLEAPSRSAVGSMEGGNMERHLDFSTAAISTINNSSTYGIGPF